MVAALIEGDKDIKLNSFNMIKNELISTTTSMSSIPRPLKFLRLHYDAIRKLYDSLDQHDPFKLLLSDFLAVLTIVTANTTDTCLSFVSKGTLKDLHTWGQEFIRYSSNLIKDFSRGNRVRIFKKTRGKYCK